MYIGIYNVYSGKDMPHQRIYEQILKYNNIKYKIIDIHDDNFFEELNEIDYLLYKWPNNDNHHLLSNILRPILESLGINYFPNKETTWHYDDKVKQYYLLKSNNIPIVKTHVFFDKNKALEYVKNVQYPIVAKLKKGASSSNVKLIKGSNSGLKYVNKAFSFNGFGPNYFGSIKHLYKTKNRNLVKTVSYLLKKYINQFRDQDGSYWERHKNYAYFQDFLPGNTYDTRVTTVGDRVHAFRRFVRPGDFRASGGTKWDINPEEIDKRMLRIALDTSKKINFQSMAYDFIYDENNNPCIVEISYLYGQPGFPDFMNGYWDFDLNWIEGRFWPQYFELLDALNLPSLKCPNIDIPPEWRKNEII